MKNMNIFKENFDFIIKNLVEQTWLQTLQSYFPSSSKSENQNISVYGDKSFNKKDESEINLPKKSKSSNQKKLPEQEIKSKQNTVEYKKTPNPMKTPRNIIKEDANDSGN